MLLDMIIRIWTKQASSIMHSIQRIARVPFVAHLEAGLSCPYESIPAAFRCEDRRICRAGACSFSSQEQDEQELDGGGMSESPNQSGRPLLDHAQTTCASFGKRFNNGPGCQSCCSTPNLPPTRLPSRFLEFRHNGRQRETHDHTEAIQHTTSLLCSKANRDHANESCSVNLTRRTILFTIKWPFKSTTILVWVPAWNNTTAAACKTAAWTNTITQVGP